MLSQNCFCRDVPGGLVVEPLHSQRRGTGSIPGQGTKILHGTQRGQKTKSYYNALLEAGSQVSRAEGVFFSDVHKGIDG